MDVGTQGLASLVIARALVPRAPWRAWAVIVIAGSIANIDVVSAMVSPSAFIEWHRTYLHSILFSLIVSLILGTTYLLVRKADARASWGATELRPYKEVGRGSVVAFLAAVLLAGLLHLALDAAQPDGTMIFWPLSHQRVALDWLPHIDAWIIAILLAALLLPELTRLVTEEIGAKARGATRARRGHHRTRYSCSLCRIASRSPQQCDCDTPESQLRHRKAPSHRRVRRRHVAISLARNRRDRARDARTRRWYFCGLGI